MIVVFTSTGVWGCFNVVADQHMWKQGKTPITATLPKPLFLCGPSEESHAEVPVLFLSHALTVACSHFLQWFSHLLCLAIHEGCSLKGNCTILHRADIYKPNVPRISFPSRSYYHGCDWYGGNVRRRSNNTSNDRNDHVRSVGRLFIMNAYKSCGNVQYSTMKQNLIQYSQL